MAAYMPAQCEISFLQVVVGMSLAFLHSNNPLQFHRFSAQHDIPTINASYSRIEGTERKLLGVARPLRLGLLMIVRAGLMIQEHEVMSLFCT